jgi:hypothetical protein
VSEWDERASARDRQGVFEKGWSGMLLLSRRRICVIPVSEVEPIDQFGYAMRWGRAVHVVVLFLRALDGFFFWL